MRLAEVAARRAVVAEPALRFEALGIGEIALADAVAAHHAPDDRAGRHADVGDHRVAQRLQRLERRDRLQPHRLVGAGVERRSSVPSRCGSCGALGVDRRARTSSLQRARSAAGMAPQQIDHPRQRVGGGVLAGQQHRQHVAGDLAVGDAAVAARRRRRSSPRAGSPDASRRRRVGREPLRAPAAMKPSIAALTAATLRSSSRSAASVVTSASTASSANMRWNSAGKILSRWLLDHVVVGLERVDVGAEREAGDGVDREAHQVGLQVDRASRCAPRAASARAGAAVTFSSDGK